MCGSSTLYPLLFVLIETSWNVKMKDHLLLIIHHCINRNIVECKEWHDIVSTTDIDRINRNIVECKDRSNSWS